MAGRGGKRPGAGRPKGSEDRAEAARQRASAIWEQQDWEGVLLEVRQSSDLRAKANVAMRLWEYMHGKPVQPISGADGGPVVTQIVNHSARPKR